MIDPGAFRGDPQRPDIQPAEYLAVDRTDLREI